MTSPPNDESSGHGGNLFFAVLAFVAIFGATYYWSGRDLNSFEEMPGPQKDDVFYDNIAFNIEQRGIFALSFSDIEWQQKYVDKNTDGRYNWIFDIKADGETTSRAPAFPYVLAGCYYVFGREWETIRFLNMLILAFGLAFLCATVRRYSGWIAAILATVIICGDLFVMRTGGQIMTEAMATGIFGLMFGCLIRVWNNLAERSKPGWRWFVVGVLFGLSILVRSNLVAWLVQLLVLGVGGLIFLAIRRKGVVPYIQGSALFLFGCVVVCAPWWARNCRATGEFAPLGCGRLGMIGGYCDESFEDRGNWSLEKTRELQFEIGVSLWDDDRDWTLAETEMETARHSSVRAIQWARDNSAILPQMMLMRVQSHLALHDGMPTYLLALNGLLFFGAILGMLGSWSRFGGWVALVLFLSCATTAMTWAHEGRYSLPIRPVLSACAAIGTVYFWSTVLKLSRGAGKPTTE
ncbi:MAG: glycosyltransferase family 39 protein [Planctomycetota bacterium]